MNRRNLLKVLGLSAVGVATVPLWMEGWTTDDLPKNNLELSEGRKHTLSEIVGTIIPSGEVPGAKDLEVNKFVWAMVSGCFEEDIQKQFLDGLDQLQAVAENNYEKPFTELPNKEQIKVLETIAAAETEEGKINFANFMKDLTISGYMNSQYVMENLKKYEFVPGRFHGSFPLENSIYSNA